VDGGPGGDAARPWLSVVVPMFNEEDTIPLLAARLRPSLDGLGVRYEVVAVDDGSTDGTAITISKLRREWPELRLVRLVRNAGHQSALAAGLVSAGGGYVVTIDADLQDPPELIPTMLAVAESDDLDVVYGVRSDRSADTRFKRWTAALFYRAMRRLAGPQVPNNAGDFRLMSRRAVDHVNALPEHGRVLRLAVPWFGFPSAQLSYAREARSAGRSKYSITRMAGLAVESVTAFSAAPLRLATWLGLLGVGVCGALIAFLIVAGVTGAGVPGWASTLLIVTTLGAFQLLSLGLLGEYIGRLYEAAQGRPGYVIGYDSGSGEESSTTSPNPAGAQQP
jgi:polyisoprenyl-phosphate glycosyltransferase